MLRRPQRTEAAQRLEARTARTLGLPLLRELGGELKQWPRAQLAETACGWSASTGRTASFAASAQRESSQRHGACALCRCCTFPSAQPACRAACRDRGPQPPAAGWALQQEAQEQPLQHMAAVRPVLALQPQAASAWLRAGPLV